MKAKNVFWKLRQISSPSEKIQLLFRFHERDYDLGSSGAFHSVRVSHVFSKT